MTQKPEDPYMHRRHFLLTAAIFVATGSVRADETIELRVAKSPTCGCCTAWVERMRQAGFALQVEDVNQDTLWALKNRLGVSPELAGCHTASVNEYFIEGHVPATDIRRLLDDGPNALGLTVPGMPMGSPGMEMGNTREPFDVLLVLKDGSTRVFSSYS